MYVIRFDSVSQVEDALTPEQVAQQCIATLCDGVLRRPVDNLARDAAALPAPQRSATRGKSKTAARADGG